MRSDFVYAASIMADETGAKAKRQKKPNFSPSEMEVLLHEIRINRRLLFSSFTNANTNQKKKEKWESIAEKVNAVGANGRTCEQVKKRFKDAKKQYLDFKREVGKTGGGTPPVPVPFEDIIAEIIGENTGLADGIPGADEMNMFDEDCTSTPASCSEKLQSDSFMNLPSTSTSSFEPVRMIDLDSTFMNDLPVGTQVHDLVVATTQTSTKAVSLQPRPASTPPRIQTAVSNKPKKSKRKLFEQTCSSISNNERHTGPEDDLWNEFLKSEIKKNEKKSELLDLQIQIAKAKVDVQRKTQSEAL